MKRGQRLAALIELVDKLVHRFVGVQIRVAQNADQIIPRALVVWGDANFFDHKVDLLLELLAALVCQLAELVHHVVPVVPGRIVAHIVQQQIFRVLDLAVEQAKLAHEPLSVLPSVVVL